MKGININMKGIRKNGGECHVMLQLLEQMLYWR